MKWNLLTQPLGMSMSDGYAPKKEIPLAIPLAMAAGSVFSSIFGAKKSADANAEAQAKLAAERAATEAERRRAKNQTWLSTASGQNTMRMLMDQADREWKRDKGAEAVGGGTNAATALGKEMRNLRQAEVIAQANANFEDKKENIDASYRQQLSGLNQQQIGLDQQRAANISQAASGISSGLMQGAMATFGGTKLGQSWMSDMGGGGASGTGASTTAGNNWLRTGTSFSRLSNNYRLLNPYILNYMRGGGTV